MSTKPFQCQLNPSNSSGPKASLSPLICSSPDSHNQTLSIFCQFQLWSLSRISLLHFHCCPPQHPVFPHNSQRILLQQAKAARGPPLLIPLLCLFQRKSQSPPRGQGCPTGPGSITSWTSPPVTHPLAHSTPALLVSLRYLKYARYAPASGPLHRLSPFI